MVVSTLLRMSWRHYHKLWSWLDIRRHFLRSLWTNFVVIGTLQIEDCFPTRCSFVFAGSAEDGDVILTCVKIYHPLAYLLLVSPEGTFYRDCRRHLVRCKFGLHLDESYPKCAFSGVGSLIWCVPCIIADVHSPCPLGPLEWYCTQWSNR